MTTSRVRENAVPGDSAAPPSFPLGLRLAGAAVHLYTASGSVLGLLIVLAAFEGEVETALWLGLATLFIDGTDGMLARHFRVKETIPWFDGARMDDIVDYLTYVFAPIVLLWTTGHLPHGALGWVLAALPLLASCYQFCRVDAKTADHFFLGFPSYWNVVAFYVIVLDVSELVTAITLVVLTVLVFVPVRYVYPSRTEPAARPERWRSPAPGWSPTPCCSSSTPTRTPSSWCCAGLPRLLRRAEPVPHGRPRGWRSRQARRARSTRSATRSCGVLDAAGQPDEARRDGVPAPLGPPVDRAVHAPEAGRRGPQPRARQQGGHGGLVGQLGGDHAVRAGASAGSPARRRDRPAARATAPR